MQLVYTSLLLIITLCLICGERKISATIKKSHNVMKMIVDWVFINNNLALQQMDLSKCLHFILKTLYNAIYSGSITKILLFASKLVIKAEISFKVA